MRSQAADSQAGDDAASQAGSAKSLTATSKGRNDGGSGGPLKMCTLRSKGIPGSGQGTSQATDEAWPKPDEDRPMSYFEGVKVDWLSALEASRDSALANMSSVAGSVAHKVAVIEAMFDPQIPQSRGRSSSPRMVSRESSCRNEPDEMVKMHCTELGAIKPVCSNSSYFQCHLLPRPQVRVMKSPQT